MALHRDAHQHREGIDNLAQAMAAIPDTSTRMKAALGKWSGLFARLVLIFHLIDVADANAQHHRSPPVSVVPEATARRAASYMRDILLPHLMRAEAIMFGAEQTHHARWIAGFVLSKGLAVIHMRDVVQAYGPLRAVERKRERMDVMDSLVIFGWLEPIPQANPAKPVSAWKVNPKVHLIFGDRAERERKARREAQQEMAEIIRSKHGKSS